MKAKSGIFLTAVAALLTIALAGCGGGNSTNAANAQSDEVLQTAADQAAADSGLSGFGAIDAANAPLVGDLLGGDLVFSYLYVETQSGAALTSPAASTAETYRALSVALSKSLRLVGRPPSSHAVQAFTTDAGGTYNCEISGTVAVTGSIDADFALTPTTYSMDFSTTRLALTFNACKNWGAEYTLWGAVQFTITDHQEGSELTADSWNYTMSIDYFLDGGVAITNGSENFTFPYSFSFIGSGSGQIDMNTSAVTYNSYAMALNMTVSGVTCSAAVSSFADVDTMAWDCF